MAIFLEETKDYFIQTHVNKYNMAEMHYHPNYELYYLISNKREYFVGDKYFEIEAGSFVLVPPYKFHRTKGKSAKRTLIYFTKEFLLQSFSEDACNRILSCFKEYLIIPPKENLNLFTQQLKKIESSTDDFSFALNLGVLLDLLSQCKPNHNCNEKMSEMLEYINNNFAHLNSIDQIADTFYISKGHLCRFFKKHMDITVIDYLNNIKIKNACKYITTTNMNMTEIASACGFNSSAYFSKIFKSIMGKTPKQYQKDNS